VIHYTRLIADLEQHGVKTDKTVTEAVAVIEAARAVVDTRPIADLRAAYETGQISATNAADAITQAATLAVASERIREASGALQDAANATLRRWVGAREDQIVKALRPAFDKAAATVQLAGRYFAPNATSDQILAGGSDAVRAREGLAAALDTLAAIRNCRVQVADCAGNPEQDATWYIEGARDLDHLDEAHRTYSGSGNAFHALAHAGYTLRLNTKTEAAKVAHGARNVSDAEEAKRREQRVAAMREERSFWTTTPGAA
jgi:hypothetical protein